MRVAFHARIEQACLLGYGVAAQRKRAHLYGAQVGNNANSCGRVSGINDSASARHARGLSSLNAPAGDNLSERTPLEVLAVATELFGESLLPYVTGRYDGRRCSGSRVSVSVPPWIPTQFYVV